MVECTQIVVTAPLLLLLPRDLWSLPSLLSEWEDADNVKAAEEEQIVIVNGGEKYNFIDTVIIVINILCKSLQKKIFLV